MNLVGRGLRRSTPTSMEFPGSTVFSQSHPLSFRRRCCSIRRRGRSGYSVDRSKSTYEDVLKNENYGEDLTSDVSQSTKSRFTVARTAVYIVEPHQLSMIGTSIGSRPRVILVFRYSGTFGSNPWTSLGSFNQERNEFAFIYFLRLWF